MTVSERQTIALIKSALDGVPCAPENADWAEIYRVAVKHYAANTVYCGIALLPDDKKPTGEIYGKFRKASIINKGKENVQAFKVGELLDRFNAEGIPALPLKGWILKNYYPTRDFRSMADVDILVGDYPAAEAVALSVGFTKDGGDGGCHSSFNIPPYLHIELHRSLFHESCPFYAYYKDLAERLLDGDNSEGIRHMSNEDFYVYQLAHSYKHFSNCGIGLRTVMDVYVLNHRFDYDRPKAEALLERLGLTKFERNLRLLSENWFGDGEALPITDKMGDYVLASGVYGTLDNEYTSIAVNVGGSGAAYFLHRAFPALSTMKIIYPVLDKAPVLLPFTWVARLIERLFNSTSNVKNELRYCVNTSNSSIEAAKKDKEEFGVIL